MLPAAPFAIGPRAANHKIAMPTPPLTPLLSQNRAWSESMRAEDPEFFMRLVEQQVPQYLWIGCSDSRVPANEIVGMAPGELFVHRNVANVVVHTDLNCLSVLQYAVEVLKVKHILVVGHYGCGGVRAAMQNMKLGLINNWLRHVQDVQQKHNFQLDKIEDEDARVDRLCELNVVEQVMNVCQTTVVEGAWERGQDLSVHGWIYRLSDGIIRDLSINVTANDNLAECRDAASTKLIAKAHKWL
ncbi:carbonic anhydrase [Roseimicrobium gellanilyticum]|uniref:Carbonic anhydrase n=2 Tax=Roseimicrobium gellanilyticum TaxID=748857 RepID=A0A366H2K6_9BACT|nr:carbonic anhydrase [Roseimicrobium gellanilyticum]